MKINGGTGVGTDDRDRRTAIAHAAKIHDTPDACPKCHAPSNYFSRYPFSLECLCGWTGFFRLPVSADDGFAETKAERAQRLSRAALTRIRNMSPQELHAHMKMMKHRSPR